MEFSTGELIKEICRELLDGSYHPQAVRRTIEKHDGGERPLGIPTISYGFRPDKSCHQACQAVWKWMNFGYTKVIDADIRKYFDTISHEKLLRSVARFCGF